MCLKPNTEAFFHAGEGEGFSLRDPEKVFALVTKSVRLIHTVMCPFSSLPVFQHGLWTSYLDLRGCLLSPEHYSDRTEGLDSQGAPAS